MRRRHIINPGGSLIVFVITCSIITAALADTSRDVPQGPSHVYVQGRQLIVQKRLADNSLGEPMPYIIKGVTWAPATRAPAKGLNPFDPTEDVPYGFFFDWADRSPQGHVVFIYWLRREYLRYYLADIPLMKEMNMNTVRVYGDFGDDPEAYKEILDEFYRNDIMVIFTVASSKDDIDRKRYRKVVRLCKDHPAILMWSLGNEWNLEYNKYWGYKTVRKAAKATDRVAVKVKKMDPYHPVSSCLGDRFFDEGRTNTVGWVVKACRSVELWGLNIYRGRDFGNLFTQWQGFTDKPMYLSEFGIDSFATDTYTMVNDFQAADCKGEEDQEAQAAWAISLWQDIEPNLSAINPDRICIGGTIHSFNDSLWKVGSYHVSLGGLIDYKDPEEASSYDEYNTEGFYLPGAAPDDVVNEEYYGLVDADRNPKQAFRELKHYYETLEQS